MNNYKGLTASHIFIDEIFQPELIGVTTSQQFRSEIFFKEDTPLEEKKDWLIESTSFVHGKHPEVRQAQYDDYWTCRRKLIEKVTRILHNKYEQEQCK